MSLENSFWDALHEIAAKRELTPAMLVEQIDGDRVGNLSSAIREFVLREYQDLKGGI